MDWKLKVFNRKVPHQAERVDKNILICGFSKKKKRKSLVFFFSLPASEWHVTSDEPAVQGGWSTGRVGSETKPRLRRQSRTLSPHPDSSEALCWIMIPRCIATASVLSFPISPVPKAHMEAVWSHCVTAYAKSLGSLRRDLPRSVLPSSSQVAFGSHIFILQRCIIFHQGDWNTGGGAPACLFEMVSWGRSGCAVILFGRAFWDKRGCRAATEFMYSPHELWLCRLHLQSG